MARHPRTMQGPREGPDHGIFSCRADLQAAAASHESWARTRNPTKRTAPARKAFDDRFLDAVDPERKLPVKERERRAASAKSAYFAKLALASAKARRAKARTTAQAKAKRRDATITKIRRAAK